MLKCGMSYGLVKRFDRFWGLVVWGLDISDDVSKERDVKGPFILCQVSVTRRSKRHRRTAARSRTTRLLDLSLLTSPFDHRGSCETVVSLSSIS